jgi:hypothetical protein
MRLFSKTVCRECREPNRIGGYRRDRYDCILGDVLDEKTGKLSKCHCRYDKMWADVKCESDCKLKYGGILCACCKVCNELRTEPLSDELKLQLIKYDNGNIIDSCSKCKREVYYSFWKCGDYTTFDERDISLKNLHTKAEIAFQICAEEYALYLKEKEIEENKRQERENKKYDWYWMERDDRIIECISMLFNYIDASTKPNISIV